MRASGIEIATSSVSARARRMTVWPAATTCPTSAVTKPMTPACSARSTVYADWLRASSACARAAR